MKYKTTEHKSLYETEQLVQSAMAQMCNLSVEDLVRQRGKYIMTVSLIFMLKFLIFVTCQTEKLAASMGGGKKKKKKSTKS